MTALPQTTARRALDSLLRGGALYLALFLTTHIVLAVTTAGLSLSDVLVLVLVSVPQAVLVVRRRLELPGSWTALLCVMLIGAAVAGVIAVGPANWADEYTFWFFGAIAFSLLGLALVGRFAAAWATMLAVVVISIAWAVHAGLGTGVGVGMVVRHAATLLVGTALAITLRRANSSLTAFRALERRRRAEERAAEARAGARRSAAESVLQQAGPMLRAIADGRHLGDGDRRELLVLEGALRDQIRAPGLADPHLTESLAAARRRGINVLLLDEAGGAPPAARAQASAWLAGELDTATSERFVGRIRALDGAVRVTAVVEEYSHSASFD